MGAVFFSAVGGAEFEVAPLIAVDRTDQNRPQTTSDSRKISTTDSINPKGPYFCKNHSTCSHIFNAPP